jgi:group I intron endonuclease
MVIYKTTNLITNKIYIGQDSKNNPNYLGSGLLLNSSIEKHGIENFKKEILEYCNSKKELNEREIYWINYYNSLDKNIGYNISTGGSGGDNITNNPNRDKFIEKQKLRTGIKNSMYSKTHSEESKQKMRHCGESNGMFGKKHKNTSIEKQKDKAKGRYTLEWFIERNGEIKGTELFLERNKRLSKQNSGENNGAFKYVNMELVNEYIIKNNYCSLKELTEIFKVGGTVLYSRFKNQNCKNLNEYKNYLSITFGNLK